MYTTLIQPTDLYPHLDDPDWAIVDCRFSLQDTDEGQRTYAEAHIPGAVYAHLDDDLSGTIIPGVTGRHPLPVVEDFADTLSAWGINRATQVVAYDAKGGAIAARLWWLMRWMGHGAVAVLDGGWPAWQAAGYPTRSGTESRTARSFVAHPQLQFIATVDEVEAIDPSTTPLLDARDAERYRGEHEPIDPVAGHIPGAHSMPFAENLENGRFRDAGALRERFEDVAGSNPICYCGSGVTANHNILAMVHAGFEMPRLYPGSWSEWITDPERGVAA